MKLCPLVLLAWTQLAAAPGGAVQVTIVSPPYDEPAFGRVVFEALVVPVDEVRSVTFLLDGEVVGERHAPPFRLQVDVGEMNRRHLFEVAVVDHRGAVERTWLETVAVPVDLEIDVELQQLYLTVTRGDHRVENLRREDFRIFDNGARQEIITFERGDIPFVAVVLVDASHSMEGQRLESALAGARIFASSMKSLDQAKLILFNDRVALETPFTSFSQVLSAGLADVRARGGTSLNDHLYAAIKLLEDRQGRRLVILLTDGIDITSVLRMREVMEIARRSQSLIYWIRLGALDPRISYFSVWRDAEDQRREIKTLERVVRQSGGRILTLTSIAETASAFVEILEEIRGQYVLGYYPTDNLDDGRWHKIRIRIDEPGVVIRGRAGYLDY